jgi:arylsulfatase A-like enzyme/cytochrome c-type biogenesis protein CcmH/NrfG
MKRRLIYITAVIVAAAVIVFLSQGPGGKDDIPNLGGETPYHLLVITVDALRADRLGAYGSGRGGSPNIDRLSRQAVLFENAYTSAPLVLPSHCTLFTGKEPVVHGVRNDMKNSLQTGEITLAEMMKSRGLVTHGVTASWLLGRKFGLDQGFDAYDDSLDPAGGGANPNAAIAAGQVFDAFNTWLNNTWLKENSEKPFFCWLHFHDPHVPYQPPEEFKSQYADDPYRGEVANVDKYIGEILKALEEKQLTKKTLIVLAGSQGEAFGEHKETGHGIFCYNETLKVPLLFANPVLFETARQESRRVRLVDVMPTLLEMYRLEPPPGLQGRSFAPLLAGSVKSPGTEPAAGETDVYFESAMGGDEFKWAPLTGMISGQYKYIALPQPELYHLGRDPHERTNLYGQEDYRREADDLQQKLKEALRRWTGKDAALPSPDAVDPKKGVVVLDELKKVNAYIAVENLAQAETLLTRLVDENPGMKMPGFYEFRFRIARKRGRSAEARKALEQGLAAFPGNRRFLMNLALSYFNNRQADKAASLCRELLKQDARHTAALMLLGKISRARGKSGQALDYYEKAANLEPRNVMLQVEYAQALMSAGRTEEAMNKVDELLRVGANDPGAGVNLGFLLLNMGRYDRVITLALELTRDGKGAKDPRVWNQLGMAYFYKKMPNKAIEAYRTALELDPERPLTLSNMGTFYLTLYRSNKDKDFYKWAVEHYTRAVKADPRMVTALNGLAAAYSYAGNQQKAVQYWRQALNVNPNFTNLYFNLGITYLKMGQKKNALTFLTQLKNRHYNRLNPREQQQLDQLLSQAGK